MNRRNFFASLFAPIVAKAVPTKAETEILATVASGAGCITTVFPEIIDADTLYPLARFFDWDGLSLGRANGRMWERLPDGRTLVGYQGAVNAWHEDHDPWRVAARRRAAFLRPKVRSAAEKRWRAEYRRARIRARTHRDRTAV